MRSAPRERRGFLAVARGADLGNFSSARAEVPRCWRSLRTRDQGQLRASGGDPLAEPDRVWGAGRLCASGGAPMFTSFSGQLWRSTPRERGCPAVELGQELGVGVGSARAEVTRWRILLGPPACSRLPQVEVSRARRGRRAGSDGRLCASGGVPLVSRGGVATVTSAPRQRRCPVDAGGVVAVGSARAGGVPDALQLRFPAPPSAPRERRCPIPQMPVVLDGQVGSARAEVSRCSGTPGCSRERRLRASGGIPASRKDALPSVQSASRERRRPAAHVLGLEHDFVGSARAEVPRRPPSPPTS